MAGCRYVTEGMFRASHRAECSAEGTPRQAAHLEGAPFHSFRAADAQPLQPGTASRISFLLMPTAYRFAKVIQTSNDFILSILVQSMLLFFCLVLTVLEAENTIAECGDCACLANSSVLES